MMQEEHKHWSLVTCHYIFLDFNFFISKMETVVKYDWTTSESYFKDQKKGTAEKTGTKEKQHVVNYKELHEKGWGL